VAALAVGKADGRDVGYVTGERMMTWGGERTWQWFRRVRK